MTNTLAYYKNTQFTDKKSFITLAPGVIDIKLFTTVIYESSNVIKLFTAVSYDFS
jgi:hypothetical protein